MPMGFNTDIVLSRNIRGVCYGPFAIIIDKDSWLTMNDAIQTER